MSLISSRMLLSVPFQISQNILETPILKEIDDPDVCLASHMAEVVAQILSLATSPGKVQALEATAPLFSPQVSFVKSVGLKQSRGTCQKASFSLVVIFIDK